MSNPTNQEQHIEQQRVDKVIELINGRIEVLEEETLGSKSEMVDIRKNFWDDVTVNFEDSAESAETFASLKQQAEVLSERERTYKQAEIQLQTLRKLQHSPYFGRIDFVEEGQSRKDLVYLGIASLRDKNDEDYLIYDWRAPISSLYYDYPPGPAQMETPMGTIHGDLLVKRQFMIRDGKIISMFDTGVTIGDELLKEVLGKQSDAQMKSIVATIQREQNRIIRDERSRLLIVQGAAGSGKTSAALQRVAYLLYRYRGILTADQIVLFSPNPMFNSYVSTVLPELGEENMQQTTFQDYLVYRIGRSFKLEDPYVQLEYALTAVEEPEYESRMAGIRYKASADYVILIERYLSHLGQEGLIFRDVNFRGEKVADAEAISDYFYGLPRTQAIANRLRLVAEWLLELLKKREAETAYEAWVDEEIELLDKETYLKAYQSLRRKTGYSGNSFDDFDRERDLLANYVVREAFKPLRSLVRKLGFINIRACFRKLFLDPEFAQGLAVECTGGSGLPVEWSSIAKQTLARLDQRVMAYEDATPFLYLVERIRGFQVNNTVRHLFIDEAQDYTAFQFAFLMRLFPRSRVTALGDLNQSIHAHSVGGASGFDALKERFDDKLTETIILTRSYRSTRPIVEFTRCFIPGGGLIEPFNRDGAKPTLTAFTDQEELQQEVGNRIKKLRSEGCRTVAVICKTAAESLNTFNALGSVGDLRLIEKETNTFEPGIVVIPSYLAKGVEFDAVIVYDASADCYGRESERRLFYTVCTRAMHELHLYMVGTAWSPFITVEAMQLAHVENKQEA
ncbi:DNA helicase [Paenibacillus baekrokdamisoli]|uniref:DNA helicase n=1 Tax=Paenibacillus baekrokdamisoli TaxID=1712516 RepID=A0A3G9J5D5_9BACL|nr:RNA polymerase recycling motor HelD [Paenibacillus baekrokdamisoli]MBB3070642.1 DNA helicase-2/ATP-dependent DNA helicase PcrA [Paenibacillus baekrokdamisoli]BBH19993.1 DNA helicase [Paenibacillus baekrokdamisoli]